MVNLQCRIFTSEIDIIEWDWNKFQPHLFINNCYNSCTSVSIWVSPFPKKFKVSNTRAFSLTPWVQHSLPLTNGNKSLCDIKINIFLMATKFNLWNTLSVISDINQKYKTNLILNKLTSFLAQTLVKSDNLIIEVVQGLGKIKCGT